MHCIKKMLLAAAVTIFTFMAAFPVFAGEPVGTNVTVVDEADAAPQDAGAGQVSHKTRASLSSNEGYVDQGPGAEKEEEVPPEPEEVSLGRFMITGYCSCEQCSGGHNLTYSGTVPTPNHTISADLNKFPIGTRLEVDGTVYTVEDKGSSVNGNMLDIFYGSHEDALAKGTYSAEVFLVQD